MITIVNKHHDRNGIYVGRPTVLGNPYTLKVYTRTDAIARYRIWLRQQWQRHGEVHAALLELARAYQERDELTLLCWCAPRRCHAEVIREAVLGIVQHGLVERPPGHQAPPAEPHRTQGGLMKLIMPGRLRTRSIAGLFPQPPSEPDVTLIASSGSPVSCVSATLAYCGGCLHDMFYILPWFCVCVLSWFSSRAAFPFYPVCSGLLAFGYGAYALFPWLHRLRTYHCIIYRLSLIVC